MYSVDRRSQRRRKRSIAFPVLILLLIVIVIGGGILARRLIHNTVTLTQSKAVVSKITAPTPTTITFQTSDFSLQLPKGWVQIAGETTPYTVYRYQDVTSTTDEIQLAIYMDTIPVNYMVNYVQVVAPNGNKVTINGGISDNCANFTKAGATIEGGGTPAKWSGVNFVCDLSNYERDVVGTSSTEGLNEVDLTGLTTGAHKFFFAFTDNSISPDYTTFDDALTSFRLK